MVTDMTDESEPRTPDSETVEIGGAGAKVRNHPFADSKDTSRNPADSKAVPDMPNGAPGRELGYMRVSTAAQTTALQRDALHAAGLPDDAIYSDTMSGSTIARPQFAALLDAAQRGDRITVWKFDRVGRSLAHFVQIVATLNERGVAFRSLTEGVDTSTPAGRMVANIWMVMAEYERELVRERTSAGLAAARARGRVGGRPTASNPEQAALVRRLANDEGKSHRQIAALTGLSRATVGRILRGEVASLEGGADEGL